MEPALDLVWSNLESEYQGKLDITLHGTVHLDERQRTFPDDGHQPFAAHHCQSELADHWLNRGTLIR